MSDLFLFMTYSGLCAVIFYRLEHDHKLNRWLLMKSAPVRGWLQMRLHDARRWNWTMITAAYCVLTVAVAVGLLWGAR